jgi:hypothetical protein
LPFSPACADDTRAIAATKRKMAANRKVRAVALIGRCSPYFRCVPRIGILKASAIADMLPEINVIYCPFGVTGAMAEVAPPYRAR